MREESPKCQPLAPPNHNTAMRGTLASRQVAKINQIITSGTSNSDITKALSRATTVATIKGSQREVEVGKEETRIHTTIISRCMITFSTSPR